MSDGALSFQEILDVVNTEGEFALTALTGEDGLPIAAAPAMPTFDVETVAAMVTLVKDFIEQTRTRLGMDTVDEVSMVISDRSRLVCRYFYAAGHWFILVVIAPPDRTYRRLTTRAIRDLRATWESGA